MALTKPKREKTKADQWAGIGGNLFGWAVIFFVIALFIDNTQYKMWLRIAAALAIIGSLIVFYLKKDIINNQINTDYRNEMLVDRTNKFLNNVSKPTRDMFLSSIPRQMLDDEEKTE